MDNIVWEVTVTQILPLPFTFAVDYCVPFHQKNLFFLTPMYNILILSGQIQFSLLFSRFHIAQATLLTILTTQEKHGGWYCLNKENCNSPKDCLFVIFLDLKLLPSAPFEALSLPATDTNTNSTFGTQWMEIQPAHSFLSSAQVKLLA